MVAAETSRKPRSMAESSAPSDSKAESSAPRRLGTLAWRELVERCPPSGPAHPLRRPRRGAGLLVADPAEQNVHNDLCTLPTEIGSIGKITMSFDLPGKWQVSSKVIELWNESMKVQAPKLWDKPKNMPKCTGR